LVRDGPAATLAMTTAMSWDTPVPIGPWLVPADELTDPHDLATRTSVDGELLRNMIPAGCDRSMDG
jgi:2-keto-4-pentenoate hydratase/2-oxohepta-3-ene-1,7-dioic acid hydratase in catechol pathway